MLSVGKTSKQTHTKKICQLNRHQLIQLSQGSATFYIIRAILAPFLPNKIHVEPQNI